MSELTKEFTDQLYANYEANVKYAALENAVTHNGIHASLETRKSAVENTPVFSLDLTKDKVTNQKASGRCWMFAALNTFRHKMISSFQLEDFELSQAHTFFWDKYEKSNWFLEQVIATADQELTSRKVAFLLQTPQQDGGQWDMVVSLFEKYGVVPKSVYPESISSSNSRELNTYLNKLLRQDAQILRDLIHSGADSEAVSSKKQALLQEIFNFLAMSLGLPPREFDFSYRDKDNQFHSESGLTPQSFYKKYVDLQLDDYVSIINAPTTDKPYGKSYTVDMLGNVVGSRPVRYLNVPMDRLKELAIAQMKAGETVAMVLTGVDLDEAGQSRKWKVENSWGDKVGTDGYFVASDAWMDEYTYQIVVRKEFLTADELAAYEAEPIVLAPWDPMGALAK